MASHYKTPARRSESTTNSSPSLIPRASQGPSSASSFTGTATSSQIGVEISSTTDSRKRQSKKDEAIRRKLENELGKKGFVQARSSRQKRYAPGTVMALRPTQPLTVVPHTTVAEASQIMAAKREDCVLVIDDDSRLAGIFTAKDLAFRVVGQGVDARDILIRDIMTENPICARQSSPATEALEIMVRRGFRHMPVLDEDGDILGILDITKCFHEAMEKLERAYASSKKLYDALEGVQTEWGGVGGQQPAQMLQYLSDLRTKMAGPDLSTVLASTPPPVLVEVRTSVRDAASLMKDNHTTAVLVMDKGRIAGIFTSKDVVLRVIAPGFDPGKTSVVRVMTPHPDTAKEDLSIQAALRKMHDGHYLNLPVVDSENQVIGIVDVLKLTYATLEQINQMNTPDGEGPMWNRFWNTLDNDTESVHSGDGHSMTNSQRPPTPSSPGNIRPASSTLLDRMMNDSVLPNDSASFAGVQVSERFDDMASNHGGNILTGLDSPVADLNFAFKFKAPKGRVHRLRFDPSYGLDAFKQALAEKLTDEEKMGVVKQSENGLSTHELGFAVSFVDDEGDVVSILNQGDLSESVALAKRAGREKVDLYIHHPDEPARPEPMIPVTLAETVDNVKEVAVEQGENLKELNRDATKVVEEKVGKFNVTGMTPELLLPSALILLGVVILGVFVASRAGGRKY